MVGINIYTLYETDNHKNQLYSTENYTQPKREKNLKKSLSIYAYISMYAQLNHCAVYLKLRQHRKPTICL